MGPCVLRLFLGIWGGGGRLLNGSCMRVSDLGWFRALGSFRRDCVKKGGVIQLTKGETFIRRFKGYLGST